MNGDTLENYYQEGLEERLISHLAKVKNLPLEQAMDIYYQSRLAQIIHDGADDVQYLDYKVLVQILLDTEPELFVKAPDHNSGDYSQLVKTVTLSYEVRKQCL